MFNITNYYIFKIINGTNLYKKFINLHTFIYKHFMFVVLD